MRLIGLSLLLIFSISCKSQGDIPKDVNADKFETAINNDKAIQVLDVRTDAELTGPLPKIKGAVHIPVQEIENRVDELEKYKDKEIVVVCRTQNRSSRAVEFLRSKGYDAKYVNGGMQEFYKK